MSVLRIELGPVSAVSAQAWVNYATDMLALLRSLPEEQIPAHALDGFASLLEEWRPIAAHDDPFRWSGEVPPERVRYLLNALYVAGTLIEREAGTGRAPLRPALADEFHVVVVREVLAALEAESRSDAQFVEQMRNVWDVARGD
jgi:hypothetical protein